MIVRCIGQGTSYVNLDVGIPDDTANELMLKPIPFKLLEYRLEKLAPNRYNLYYTIEHFIF